MSSTDNFSKKLSKVIKVKIEKVKAIVVTYRRQNLNSNSLQFRLILGIIVIFIVELISFNVWTDWEMKKFFITIDTQQIIYNDRTSLLTVIGHFRNISILLIATSTVVTILFIWRSLLPLRQINRWTAISAIQLNSSGLKLKWTPRELRSLVGTWNQLLTRFSEIREQQRQFTINLAHELRTPLSMVYAYLKRSQQKNHHLNDSQQEALTMAVEEAERMTQIVQDLIALARADSSNSMSFEMESLILNDLVTEVAQMTEKFDRRSIRVKVASFPVIVKADRNYLMQVLSHLVNNAIKYSDPAELIILKLTQSDNWAVIEVIDRGCGIPQSEQSHIFEPFYRVDPSRTRSTGGVGLGLYIVKRLVESMDGCIEVHSQLSKGSTFVLKLPILGAKP
jgi:signal transduction histidine kinase